MGTSVKTCDGAELALATAIDEIIARLRAGESFDLEEYVSECPDHAEDLRRLFPTLQVLADLRELGPYNRPPNAELLQEPGAESGSTTLRGILGDYRILREIGRGGMGVVYEAEQLSLGRRVALKVLPFAAVLDPKYFQRFKNEARAAGSLDHPHIVHVYSVGCDRGVHYYAMQYIEGQTLAQVIEELRRASGPLPDAAQGPPDGLSQLASNLVTGRLERSIPEASGKEAAGDHPPEPPQPATSSAETELQPQAAIATEGSIRSRQFVRSAAQLGIQAAEALEHAHKTGVVHRDIKPSNLMVDTTGHLWITDFGLAMTRKEPNLTLAGDVVGTLRYMSPEQLQAKHEVMDHRTDIYSLGITLYELVTLQPAFGQPDRQGLIQRIIEEEPLPLRQVNRAIPKDLETILLKATAKEPQSRYSTAQELADDLRRFLHDEPIRAKRPSLATRATKWSRRHRAVVWSAVVLLVIATVGFAISTVLIARERTRTMRAYQAEKRQRERANANLQLAMQVLDEIYTRRVSKRIDQYDRPTNIDLGKVLALYSKAVELDPNHVAAYYGRGRIYHDQKRYDLALADYTKAVELDPNHVAAYYNRARVHYTQKQYDLALVDFSKALELDPKDPEVYWYRGCLYCDLKQYDRALADFNKAVEVDPKCFGAYYSRGHIYLGRKQYDLALANFNRALELDPEDPVIYCDRGHVYCDLKQYDLALADFAEALQLAPKYGVDAKCYAYYNRGRVYHAQKQYDLALADFQKTLALRPTRARLAGFTVLVNLVKPYSEHGYDLFYLAMAYWKLDKKAEARKWYEKGVEWIEQNPHEEQGLSRFRAEAAKLLEVQEEE